MPLASTAGARIPALPSRRSLSQQAVCNLASIPRRAARRRWPPSLSAAGASGDVAGFVGPAKYTDRAEFIDAILGFSEALLLVPAVLFSIGCLWCSVSAVPQLLAQVVLNKKFLLWQNLLLSGSLVIGRISRNRRWQRINRVDEKGRSIGLVGRIGKAEEEIRSTGTIARMLLRHLEKLGVRFRLTRNAMKGPIAEAAELAQKNSGAARALAMKGDALEKEVRELQNVLLAMQEQQQKQLELILSIGKAVKLGDAVQQINASSSQSIDPTTETTDKSSNEVPVGSLGGRKDTAPP